MITPPARVDEGATLILEVACTAAAGGSAERASAHGRERSARVFIHLAAYSEDLR